MIYTQEDLSNIAIRVACCVADMAKEAIYAEYLGKVKCKLKTEEKVYYLKGVMCILENYVIDVDDNCIAEDDLLNIIENINTMCCDCCKDKDDITADI